MEELFIGYLLNALDERDQREVETYLAAHPEARQKLALLEQALAPLASDRAVVETPPPLLAERTLALVAEHICAPEKPLPMAPPVPRQSLSGGRSWWRRADVMVAASLLITAVGIALVILGRLRGPNSATMVVECKNNLREFYTSLQQYRDVHGRFPDVNKESPRDVAGMVVPILKDAGTLSDAVSIRCPGMGTPLSCSFSVNDLRNMNDAEFATHSGSLSMGYAYSLGYRDSGGTIRGPCDGSQTVFSQSPIMADRPPAEGVKLNSINHGGDGQNVLFADGHVQFLVRRALGTDEDIFLNRAKVVAAGLDVADVVLGYSSARSQP
jgi:prepilin-type processing-associated H-X9-DG protein